MLKLIFAAIVYIIVTHVISCEMSFLSFLLAAYSYNPTYPRQAVQADCSWVYVDNWGTGYKVSYQEFIDEVRTNKGR